MFGKSVRVTDQYGTRLFGTGFALGHDGLPGFKFDLSAPYTCCLICGEVFQADEDRLLHLQPSRSAMRLLARQEWAERHSKTHPRAVHEALRKSGKFCTPEAAHKLAPLGIVDYNPDDENWHAMKEAPRAPVNDVEGSR